MSLKLARVCDKTFFLSKLMHVNDNVFNILFCSSFLLLQLLSGSGQTTTASAQSPVPANTGTGGSGVVVGNANNG